MESLVSGSSQHGAADRDFHSRYSAGESVRSRDQDMGEYGVIFFIERNATPLVKGRSRCELNISHVYAELPGLSCMWFSDEHE